LVFIDNLFDKCACEKNHHFCKEFAHMQPVSVPPKAGKVTFQYGLIFGVIQAVIATIVLLLNDLVLTSAGISILLSIFAFLTGLAAYFVAGILAVKQTGRLRNGTFAGMWTGAVYGLIDCVVNLVLFFEVSLPKALSILDSTQTTANPDTLRTGAIIGGVFVIVFGLAFAIGVGAGLGVLGGLIGRNISNVRSVPAVPVQPYFPGQPAIDPYSGQPMVNPYPGQPAANPYSDQPYRGIEQ